MKDRPCIADRCRNNSQYSLRNFEGNSCTLTVNVIKQKNTQWIKVRSMNYSIDDYKDKIINHYTSIWGDDFHEKGFKGLIEQVVTYFCILE